MASIYSPDFVNSEPASVVTRGVTTWVTFAGITFFTDDPETGDILAGALNLCADRIRQKEQAELNASYERMAGAVADAVAGPVESEVV